MTKKQHEAYLEWWREYRKKNREKLRAYNTNWKREYRKRLKQNI